MTATISTFEYFNFEKDFVENNIRCIPMIVRFKLDACGVKLKLAEWSKMNGQEREILAGASCDTPTEILRYKHYLQHLVWLRTGQKATLLIIDENPPWSILSSIPDQLNDKLKEHDYNMSLLQWQRLSELQRFALVKLSRESHENKNFPKALREFNLV